MHDSRDAINNMTATTYEFTALDIIDKQNRFFSLSELRKGEKIYIKITEQKLIFDPTTVKEENIGDTPHTEFTSNSHLSTLSLLILSSRQITSSACSGISTSTSFIKKKKPQALRPRTHNLHTTTSTGQSECQNIRRTIMYKHDNPVRGFFPNYTSESPTLYEIRTNDL